MSKIWQQLLAIWGRLEIAQKATIVLAAIGATALFIALGYGATRPDYRALASDLTKAQVAEIAAYLDQKKIAYQVADRETSILVPSKDLYHLRNELSEREMLSDGSKGFELLNKSNMWGSTFSEHKTYDRAVAGELERSFRELPGVRSARVLIDRPQPSPFVEDDSGKPKASIKLDMKQGMRLNERQVAGVMRLCAGAIAGLSTDRVEVMDSSGSLTPNTPDSGAAMAQTTLEAEAAREAYLTRKAQEQLDTVLGPGRSQVKVSVKLDFTKRSEASSDPTKSVLLEEHTLTSDEKIPVLAGGGVAGTQPNVEGERQNNSAPPAMGSKTSEKGETKYVVGKKTITQEDEVGRIKGMNVALLLDFKTAQVPKLDDQGKPTKEMTEKREEFTAEEQTRFRELVLNAIGFNAAKDIAAKLEGVANLDARFTASVQSMALFRPEPELVAASGVMSLGPAKLLDYIGYGVAGIVALAFILVARGQLKRSHDAWVAAEARARAQVDADAAKQKTEDVATNIDDSKDQDRAKRLELKEAIKKKITDDPNLAAQVVRQWLYE